MNLSEFALEIGISWSICRAILRIWDTNLVLEIGTCETKTIKGAYGFGGETTNSSKDLDIIYYIATYVRKKEEKTTAITSLNLCTKKGARSYY